MPTGEYRSVENRPHTGGPLPLLLKQCLFSRNRISYSRTSLALRALFRTSGIPMNRDRLRPDATDGRPTSSRPLHLTGRETGYTEDVGHGDPTLLGTAGPILTTQMLPEPANPRHPPITSINPGFSDWLIADPQSRRSLRVFVPSWSNSANCRQSPPPEN